jgi:hypothetical protein
MRTVEAVLCEDSKSVGFYHYDGDELISFTTQALPMVISEEAFQELRSEWELSATALKANSK